MHIYTGAFYQFTDLRVQPGSHCERSMWQYKSQNMARNMSISHAKNVGWPQNNRRPFLPWPWSKGWAMTIRHPFSLLLLFMLLEIKRWHRATTSCHVQNILTDFEPPYYWLMWVPIRRASDPPIRGQSNFFGKYDWMTILIPRDINIFGMLFTCYIMLSIPEEYSDPPTPYPP